MAYHTYYRCANNYPDENRPNVRWKGEALEEAIINDLAGLRLPSQEVVEWVRKTLTIAFRDVEAYQNRQAASLAKRRSISRTVC